MGGAERAERKRKQQAVQAAKAAPATAPETRGGRRGAVAVIALTLLALIVGGGMWFLHQRDLPAAIPVAAPGPSYPVTPEGNTVVIGVPDAPVTIDIYEDFLCAGCGQFEQLYGSQLETAAAQGQARVVYHPVAILDDYSEPAGYSTLAGGAALCAAEAGVFPRFHDSLFNTQPQGNGPGWTSAQLQQLGNALGAGPEFARCVQGDHERIGIATDQARDYLSSRRPDGRLGTPTILVNGTITDTSEPGWLDEALGAAR
ncbi:MAG TPA: thioredoxin domain-containing protein [Pseudonocardiaceae bacterium]|nr:thioredoxin domain-containing protein [Pseudonocardiaceae bacterium]